MPFAPRARSSSSKTRARMKRLGKPRPPRNAKGSGGFLRLCILCVLIILAFGLFSLLYFGEAAKERTLSLPLNPKQVHRSRFLGPASRLVGPSYTQNAGESAIPITSAESEMRVIRHLGPKISSCFEPPFGNIIQGAEKADRGEECLPEECSANSTRCRNTFGQCHQVSLLFLSILSISANINR